MRRAGVGLIVGALLTVGCSGGGGGTNAATFAAKGNEICQKLANDDATARATLGVSPTPDALTTYIQATFVPEATETYRQVGALPRPSDKKADIDALVIDVLAEIHVIQGDPVGGGDRANQAELVQRLRNFGLTACGAGFAATVDKASFITRANAFCTNVQGQLARQLNDLDAQKTVTTEMKASFVTGTVVPLYQQTNDFIEAIGFPPADTDYLKALLKDARAYTASLLTAPEKFFVRGTDPVTIDIYKRWHEYGATSCG